MKAQEFSEEPQKLQSRRPPYLFSVLPQLPLVFALLSTATSALLLGIFSLAIGDNFWSTSGKDGRRGNGYCEEIQLSSSVRTPYNSWTNLAYITCGGWVLGRAAESWRGGQVHQELYPAELPLALLLLAGICSVSLGFGSFFYHAALVRWAQTFDVAAMYWVGNSALTATLWRWLRRVGPAVAPRRLLYLSPVLVANVIVDVIMYVKKWDMSSRVVFSAQMFGSITSEAFHMALTWPPRQRIATRSDCECSRRLSCRLAIVGLGALLVGLAGFWVRETGVADRKHMKKTGEISAFCDPKSAFQPHAVWHILTAVALTGLWELQLGRQSSPQVLDEADQSTPVVVLGRSDVPPREAAEPALDIGNPEA